MNSALLVHLEGELKDVERKAEALRQVVTGLRTLNGDLHLPDPLARALDEARENGISPAVVAATYPRGMEAVRIITSERPGIWTLEQLHDEFAKRGWTHTDDPKRAHAVIDSAVYRMWKVRGEIQRVKPGVYRFPAPDQQGVMGA